VYFLELSAGSWCSRKFDFLLRQMKIGIAVAVCLFAKAAYSQEDRQLAETNDPDIAIFAISAIDGNFSKLKSGIYHARGILEISRERHSVEGAHRADVFLDEYLVDQGWTSRSERKLLFFSAFDYSKGQYRIDRRESAPLVRNASDEMAGSIEPEMGRDSDAYNLFKWVLVPDSSIRFRSGSIASGPQVAVVDVSAPRNISAFRPFLDIRSLSLISFDGLSRMGFPYDQWKLKMREDMVVDNATWQGDLLGITFRIKNDTPQDHPLGLYRSRYWFDRSRDFMVSRRETFINLPDAKPSEWTESSWQNISGVWVPDSFRAVRYYPERREELALSFSWETVDQPIPDSLFTWQRLDLGRGTKVLDARLSPEHPVEIAEIGRDQSKQIIPEVARGRSTVKTILIYLNFCVLFVVCIGLVLYYFRSHHKKVE